MIPQQLKTALSLPKILKNAPFYIVNFLLDRNTETEYELRNGLFFKLKSRCDQEILNEVWLHKDYSPAGFKIKPTDIVIDIGAQKGVFSVYAATQASKGKVLSFEPFKENYDLLV